MESEGGCDGRSGEAVPVFESVERCNEGGSRESIFWCSPSFGLPSSSVGALGLGAEVGPGEAVVTITER
jgi:hypothetical protein